jgi:ubiquinone/menaquinone biosynthesis C-methylase UbiE
MGADHTTSYVFDEIVARDYETWYEQGFGRWAVRQEEALLHQQLQQFPGATSLLEVGCGTGHFTRWFAKQGLHVVGLDASPAMLEQARLRNGTSYLQGDAQALPFEDRRFDLVAIITTLEFVTDPVQALREAMRVARQGLLLGVLNRHSLLEYMRLLRGQRPVGVLAQAHRFSVKDLKQCVRQAAGKRSVMTTWRTTIFPGRLPPRAIWLPWGEYLGMSVHLEPMERSKSCI